VVLPLNGLSNRAVTFDSYSTLVDVDAAERTGTPIQEIAHVTAGWFDMMGAIHSGMQGVWADRKGSPWETFGSDPDRTIETFFELADALGV